MKKKNYILISALSLCLFTPTFAEDAKEVLCFENFDKLSNEAIPDGWSQDVNNGTVIVSKNEYQDGLRVSGFNNYAEPFSGSKTFYHTKTSQNQILTTYTNNLNFEAGKKYYLECYLFSYNNDVDKGNIDISFSYGVTTTMDSHTTIENFSERIFPDHSSTDNRTEIIPDSWGEDDYCWTKVKMNFTPQETDVYYIGISISNVECFVMLDNFEIYTMDDPAVTADFSFTGGVYSTNPKNKESELIYLFPGQKLSFFGKADYADSYSWVTGGTPSEFDEKDVEVSYDKSGIHTVSFTSLNSTSSATQIKDFNISIIGENAFSDQISNLTYSDNTVSVESSRSLCGHVNGVNRYYYSIAEKYEMPDNVTAKINSISFDLQEYYMTSTNRDKNISVTIYAEKDGYPDDNNILGKFTDAIYNVIGEDDVKINYDELDYTVDTRTVEFKEPIEVTGNYFIAIEIDNDINIVKNSNSFSFSSRGAIFSIAGYLRNDKLTSAYAKLNEYGSDNLGMSQVWYNTDELMAELYDIKKGLSFYIRPNISFSQMIFTSIETQEISPNIYIDENILCITGITDKTPVNIYSLSGSSIYSSLSSNREMNISIENFEPGLYIIRIGNKGYKIIK